MWKQCWNPDYYNQKNRIRIIESHIIFYNKIALVKSSVANSQMRVSPHLIQQMTIFLKVLNFTDLKYNQATRKCRLACVELLNVSQSLKGQYSDSFEGLNGMFWYLST